MKTPEHVKAYGKPVLEILCSQVAFDAGFLGLLHGQAPSLDEILACANWREDRLRNWFASGWEQDPQVLCAKQTGEATEICQHGNIRSAQDGPGHLVMLIRPETYQPPRDWVLVLWRREKPFTASQRASLDCVLASCQASRNHDCEKDLGRLTLGQDHRLIHADPQTRQTLMDHPGNLQILTEALQVTAAQRWSDLASGKPHDLVVQMEDQLQWIVFYGCRIFDESQVVHWLIEARPCHLPCLPAIGTLKDGRIARAIGFIHDQFHTNPKLNQIAEAAHISTFHFHRLFGRQVGISPKHYLQGRQLLLAQWQLKHTRQDLRQIARNCGFSDEGHFAATFHRLLGDSPSLYRQSLTSEESDSRMF